MENLHPDLFEGIEINAALQLQGRWVSKKKFEYNNIAIDISMLDPEGTIKIDTLMDKDSCKRIPVVEIINGYLMVRLRREL